MSFVSRKPKLLLLEYETFGFLRLESNIRGTLVVNVSSYRNMLHVAEN